MARLGLYQPFIEDRNVRRLYQLKVRFREREGRRVPMTVLVNRILDDFFAAGFSLAPDGDAQPQDPESYALLATHFL
ncbi:MAG: hypothetical protein EDX89_04590 [Acidobacteria bacterium]|nr:MAG: hypothetical protein EDX89_04590 [Acidobacteriota bacterium]MCE7957137.1 hypothetical protein [Acidobacteria bacterium ACB2]